MLDPCTSVGTGYSESKWVAERIVESSRAWSNPLVVRIGQLAGGLDGNWDVREWLPSLVRTSVELGKLPELKGVSCHSAHLTYVRLTRYCSPPPGFL